MQKTDFPFEVLIHDDASTDGTEEIIREYAEKYPNIFKPLYETKNQYSKGVSVTKTYNFPRVKGEYVAFCEGDDYWTDEYKLQKQVDFLDANPDYTICFHPVKRIFETGIKENDIIPGEKIIRKGFTFKNLLQYNFIQTNSVMYRWGAVEDITKNFPSNILPGDWYLHLMFAQKGKIKFINEIMSVYRVNAQGVWYECYTNTEHLYSKNCFKIMNFYKNVYYNIIYNREEFFKIYLTKIQDLYKIVQENKSFYENLKFKTQYFDFTLELLIRTFLYNMKLLFLILF